MDFTIVEKLTNYYNNEEIKAAALEELENKELKTNDMAWLGEKQPFRVDK